MYLPNWSGIVNSKGHIIVSDDDLSIVKNELVDHIELTQPESGCVGFKVIVAPLKPNKFDVYEEFLNQTSFNKHQKRIKISTWGQATHNIERHYTISH